MNEIFNLVNEMSPYLLLGFLIAGLMHAFIPGKVYSRYLAGHNVRSIIYATLLGIPLPLCSCGVIPTAMSLRKEGASKGATVSFLIATPETGVDSIAATYSLLGLPFAILRPLAALCNAMLAGIFVNAFDKEDTVKEGNDNVINISKPEKKSFAAKLKEAITYAYGEMMEDIGKWLVIGLVIAGLITLLVPDSFFAIFRDNTLLSMILVLCIAVPMYICATGSIPIAVALMLKGLTPGAALVLLMAGPACNMASILVINKVMGRRTLLIYLMSIFTCAIAWGTIVDLVLPTEWFRVSSAVACCTEHEPSWFNTGCTIVLCLLLLRALWSRFYHPHCHCHEGHGGCNCHESHSDCHCHENEQDNHGNHCSCGCQSETDNINSKDSNNMKEFKIKGMNCSHCQASAQRALQSVEGVESASVNLASGMATVKGTASMDALKSAVEALGFTVEA